MGKNFTQKYFSYRDIWLSEVYVFGSQIFCFLGEFLPDFIIFILTSRLKI